ncbi:hypothetical protein CEXT_133341 [Caerostris extrusa]|uniref:Uncharacterized protein n=1 Tax=Caerostris extrusa TaxID=172846 RepID=A0AAV4YF23_CAEEX|nr:hypothetical protein CEXT_133341 [Caerostris extrusa]
MEDPVLDPFLCTSAYSLLLGLFGVGVLFSRCHFTQGCRSSWNRKVQSMEKVRLSPVLVIVNTSEAISCPLVYLLP